MKAQPITSLLKLANMKKMQKAKSKKRLHSAKAGYFNKIYISLTFFASGSWLSFI